MARRKITPGTWLKGARQSLRNGTITNPFETQRLINAASDQQEARESHKGGFEPPVHGTIDGKKVTASFGWGSKKGETLLADGWIESRTFMQSANHNHYGKGAGPHNNVKDFLKYTGPDH